MTTATDAFGSPEASPAPPTPTGPGEGPLEQAAAVLGSISELPLEQHPALFARFDTLLREALDASPQVSSR